MRISRKRGQPADKRMSAPLAFSGDARPPSDAEAQTTSRGSSGGSPASGIAPPSDPLSEEAIFERTSASGWYVVDDDGFNRPVAYRRTPRFDDRAERTAHPRMLFKATEELPEWVRANNSLWLPRCFISVAKPPCAGTPDELAAPATDSVRVPSVASGAVLDAPGVLPTGSSEGPAGSISGTSVVESDAELEATPDFQQVNGSSCLWASFRILDTEQVTGSNGSSGFTRYRICTSTTNGHSWIIFKRYSDFQNLRQRLVESGVPGITGVPFPKKKLRRKNSVREETIEVRTEALQHWLDELLTIQVDHELLDVFMGAQRQMWRLMDENRALQEETVRLVRRTEVLANERDDERRSRCKFEEQLEEVEAARQDAVAKMQDMRMEVRKWQAATRQAERERDAASPSVASKQPQRQHVRPASSAILAEFDAEIEAAPEIDSVMSSGACDGREHMGAGQVSRQRRTRSANAAVSGSNRPSRLRPERDQRVDGSGMSSPRVVRRLAGPDAPMVVFGMQGDPRSVSVPEPEPEPQPDSATQSSRYTTSMASMLSSSGGSGNRIGTMRSRMKQAMQKEEDPNRLTELVLESMSFGSALETERAALQDRFERILKLQALHQSSSYAVKDLSHIK